MLGLQCEVALVVDAKAGMVGEISVQHELLDGMCAATEQNVKAPA